MLIAFPAMLFCLFLCLTVVSVKYDNAFVAACFSASATIWIVVMVQAIKGV